MPQRKQNGRNRYGKRSGEKVDDASITEHASKFDGTVKHGKQSSGRARRHDTAVEARFFVLVKCRSIAMHDTNLMFSDITDAS